MTMSKWPGMGDLVAGGAPDSGTVAGVKFAADGLNVRVLNFHEYPGSNVAQKIGGTDA